MSKRYEWINGETYCDSDQMYDNETGNKTQPVYVADLLNEQDQKIKELEHRLSNCIEPKFKVGQEIYVNALNYYDGEKRVLHSVPQKIVGIKYQYELENYPYWDAKEREIFATEEEAKAKLEELKNGK